MNNLVLRNRPADAYSADRNPKTLPKMARRLTRLPPAFVCFAGISQDRLRQRQALDVGPGYGPRSQKEQAVLLRSFEEGFVQERNVLQKQDLLLRRGIIRTVESVFCRITYPDRTGYTTMEPARSTPP